jgi:HSP20 family protein
MSNIRLHTPANNLRRLHRELDRTVGSVFPSFGYVDPKAWNDFAKDFSPKMDVVETDNSFLLEIDVPGINKDDVEISLHEGILTIRGERKAREIEETETSIRSERVSGSFSRALRLPSEIKEKKISARMENGVLFVELPKAEEIKPHSIKIS